MIKEFEQKIDQKDCEILKLQKENQKLREIMQIKNEVGAPTKDEIVMEIIRYERSLRMRDDNQTQTEVKSFNDQNVNTTQIMPTRMLEINQLESSDEKVSFRESSGIFLSIKIDIDHLQSMDRIIKPNEEHKILTTPKNENNLRSVKSDSRIFGTMVHGHNKNSIFSLKKSNKESILNKEHNFSHEQKKNSRNSQFGLSLEPINKFEDAADECPLKTLEKPLVITPDNENNQIPQIFKNSEIINKSNSKSRYVEDEFDGDEEEEDFYDADSPLEKPGKI